MAGPSLEAAKAAASPVASSTAETDHHAVETGTTRLRFAVLALFVLLGVGAQMQYVSFANIVRHVQHRVDASAFAVTMLTGLVPLVYVVAVLPALGVVRTQGLRVGLLCGSGTCLVAGLAKVALLVWWPRYAALVVVQVLVGIAQTFFLSLPVLLAATWFPVEERSIATAVGTLASFLGVGLGFAIPPQVVTDTRRGPGDFGLLFGIEAAVMLVAVVGIAAVVPRVPALPPSLTSPQAVALVMARKSQPASPVTAQPQDMPTFLDRAVLFLAPPSGLLRQLWSQRGNKELLLLVLTFGLFNGTLIALNNVSPQSAETLGIKPRHIGIVLLVSICLGAVCCVLCSPVVDRFRRYKAPIAVCYGLVAAILAVVASLISADAVPHGTQWTVAAYVYTPFIATLQSGMYPVALEFVVEVTHPTMPAAGTTACFALSYVISFFFTMAMSAVLTGAPTTGRAAAITWSMVAVGAVCSVVVAVFVQENRKRLAAERASKAFIEHDDDGAVPSQQPTPQGDDNEAV